MKLNKAAMFGLDARIALAIFGALSVISGAALYSAIKSAKVVSFHNQLEEISKAYEQYYLDTGSHLPYRAGISDATLLAADLVEDNSVSGWNGPYINATRNDVHYLTLPTAFGTTSLFIYQCTDTFGGDFSNVACPACNGATPCSVWIKSGGSTFGSDNALNLDEQIDGGDGIDAGKFRVQYADAAVSNNVRIFYKIMPMK
tara:strand:- start:739 stop:1341 length:603 start_codon:yes stop_codon:yes gene_type:complete